jgi:hypothetical protein
MDGDDAGRPAADATAGSTRDEAAGGDPFAHARRLGRRAAHGLILVVAVLFIGASTSQLVRAIFGGVAIPPPALDPSCAVGLRRLAMALDRAASTSIPAAQESVASPPDDPVAVFRLALAPEWDGADAIQRICTSSAGGADAWAALERLRSAQEQLTRRTRADLAPLREDLTAHFPTELR